MCYCYNDLWLLMTPNFRREIGVGTSLFSALLVTLCGLLKNVREALQISLVPDPTKEGPLA